MVQGSGPVPCVGWFDDNFYQSGGVRKGTLMVSFLRLGQSSHKMCRKAKRQRSTRHTAARRHHLENLEPRVLLSAAVANPPAVQTYYLPYTAASVLQTLQ